MHAAEPASSPRLRIRRSAAITVAAFIAWLTVGPLALALMIEQPLWDWFSTVLGLAMLAAPIVFSVWAWRSGVDVTREGITVRRLTSHRLIEWRHIDGFATDEEGVAAILDDQSQVRLKPLRAENLPKVLEIGGQELRDDSEPEAD
ncbi:PH domain-containing protein [Glycomyces sp. L485]|uniref:PH domain-containing protein n=1 Tax=Glycomyces sp. L485 TaxID=2909235 RepID=UPI001F4AE6C0|nr:PH domain-containing protein [Glycomyces sp. L485]MCH7230983.1 PH domain-containing protein [Glycomyces sp. L485]